MFNNSLSSRWKIIKNSIPCLPWALLFYLNLEKGDSNVLEGFLQPGESRDWVCN